MASYCFAEGRRELFTEACVRGWLAAIQDFPQRKSFSEAEAHARGECHALRSEVCCIPCNGAYEHLVLSAYCSTYRAFEDLTERLIAQLVFYLKSLPVEEARSIARHGFADERTYLDQIYARYVEAAEFV